MARGRFISNAIISDKKINSLRDDTSRLAFTWLITTADAEGRTHGDPAMVRSLLFPRRIDVTVEQIEEYISEWAGLGLIRWYEANGDLWIDFPNFEKYQIGLRKEREPSSQIPPHIDGQLLHSVPDNFRQPSGNLPAQIKLIEENGREAIVGVNADEIEQKPSTKRQEHNQAIDSLVGSFTDLTSIPRPNGHGPKGTAATRWYAPLNRLWSMCHKDTERTRNLMEQAVKQMRHDKLRISAPQSIEKVAMSLFGETFTPQEYYT